MNDVIEEERHEAVSAGDEPVSGRSSPFGHVEWGFSALERWLSYFGLIFLIGLMLMVVVEVVARYIFNKPVHGYIDIMEMMMAILVFLTLAYCQREGGHIRMEIFMTRGLAAGRPYFTAELFHVTLSLLGFAIIAYFSITEAIHAYDINDRSMTLLWPTWPAKSLISVGAIFLCLRFVVQLFQYAGKVISGAKS